MIHKILQSSGLRQSLVLSGGNLFAAVFSAAALIFISRTLGPVLFGEFTVGYSLMIIIVRLQGLGITVALQKMAGKYFQQDSWEKKFSHLLHIATKYNVVMAVVFFALSLVMALPLSNFLHLSSKGIIFASFVLATVTVFFEYFTSILQILHLFSKSVAMMLLQSVLKLVVGISIFALHVQTAVIVFYTFYLTPIFGTLLGWSFLPKKITVLPLENDFVLEKTFLKLLKHTAILMATAGVIDYIDVLFVKRYTSAFDTGIYGGISQISSAVALVAFSLAAVLNARVARYHDKSHLDAYLKKSVAIIIASIAGFLTYLPLAKLSILITVGSQYLPGLPYIPYLMAASFLLLATMPYIALFYSFDSHLYFSLSGLGQIIIVLIGGNFLISHFGLMGAVWVKIINKLFLFLLTVIWAFFAYRKKYAAARK
jgi:O-antigen/teichoic acid export membrane protein